MLPVGVALALLLLFSSVASALLSGDASLSYTSYDGSARSADGSERNHMSSSSLVQNYSLLYSSNGSIYNSRVGRYDVSLGYNWTALDTAFKSSTQPADTYNDARGHLLYKGEITLDPREVPFKLNVYSRDITSNSITTSTGRGLENFGSILGGREQATSINDGLHMESGATLIAGVKNGMTNGYNEVLRHFPMILIDFKDTVNRDLSSMTPVDDRFSRLAFVSLNKKENWFHYRNTRYDDNLNPLNNYVENQVQLGTVDQYMARRWIDFSNWLRVSTDLQLSKRKSNYQINPIEEINLNLFVAAERSHWNARSFTSFNRNKNENNTLTYQTTLPLFAAGVVSQDVSWNARTSYRNNHDIAANGVSSEFTDMLAGYRVDAFKRAPFTLSQGFDVESSKTYSSDYLTLSGALETVSTSRFSRNVTLAASYHINNSSTLTDVDSASNFLEQRLELRGGYAPLNTLRFDLRQGNTFTKGNFTPFNGTTSNSETLLGQYVSPNNLSASKTGAESYHSLTSLSVSWNPKPRLNADLTLNEDLFKSNVLALSAVTEVRSSVSFVSDVFNIRNAFIYTHGSREALGSNADSLSNSTSLRYIHSRNLDATANATYLASSLDGNTSRSITFEQRANYNYFTKNGANRKLFEINETFMYSAGIGNTSAASPKSLLLGCKYYPLRQLALTTGVGYAYRTSFGDYTLVWNASAVANFRLMQASLDFVHGIRNIDGARESKFTGNIRKSF